MKKTCENSAKIEKSGPISMIFQQIGQNIDKKEQIEAFWGNIKYRQKRTNRSILRKYKI